MLGGTARSGAWLHDGDLLLAITGQGLMRVPAAGGAFREAPGFHSGDVSRAPDRQHRCLR